MNDEPAFPINGHAQDHQFNGMSLRDYFAAKAMYAHIVGRGEFADSNKKVIAECAYDMADAMLEARK